MKCWPNMHLCEKVGLLSTGEFLSITKQKKKKNCWKEHTESISLLQMKITFF